MVIKLPNLFCNHKLNLILFQYLCQVQTSPTKYKKISMMLLNYRKIKFSMEMMSIRKVVQMMKEREVEVKASQRKKEK